MGCVPRGTSASSCTCFQRLDNKGGGYSCGNGNSAGDYIQNGFPLNVVELRLNWRRGLNRLKNGEKVPVIITECYSL
jgi:hypothetical protein